MSNDADGCSGCLVVVGIIAITVGFGLLFGPAAAVIMIGIALVIFGILLDLNS